MSTTRTIHRPLSQSGLSFLKRTVSFLFRLGVTTGLLIFIYRKIDVSLFRNILFQSDLSLFVFSFFIFFISNLTGGLQYYFLLRSHGTEKPPLGSVMKIYLLSSFFNNFLPTNIGGDGIKVYRLMRMGLDKKIVLSSVIWDRFTGIMILLFFSLFFGIMVTGSSRLAGALFLFVFCVLLFIILVKKFGLGKLLLRIIRPVRNEKIKLFLHEFLSSFRIYLKKSNGILVFYALSFLTQFLKIFFALFIARAVRLQVSLPELCTMLPVIGIVSSLPLSINGLGIREYVGVLLFATLRKDKALVSIFITIGNIIIMLANSTGALFMLIREKKTGKP